MSNLRIVIIFTLIIGCSLKRVDKNVKLESPLQLTDSIVKTDKYKLAKWNLYCIYCDDSVKIKRANNNDTIVTFGSLSLELRRVIISRDSLILKFYFSTKDLYSGVVEFIDFEHGYKVFTDGVLYVKDSLSRYTTPTTMRFFWEEGIRSRFSNPLQPEVIRYIENNNEKLHPWFRNEARRRKIIK